MTAYFMVRAQLVDLALKNDFGRWYETEHLPQALAGFRAKRAFRGWSGKEAGVHYAFYEFADAKQALAIVDTAAFRELVAEFDRCWGNKVTRSRDFIDIAQLLQAA